MECVSAVYTAQPRREVEVVMPVEKHLSGRVRRQRECSPASTCNVLVIRCAIKLMNSRVELCIVILVTRV